MQRRDFLAGVGASTLIAATMTARAQAQPKLFVKRFGSTDELAAYTRLSALQQPLLMAHRAGYQPWGGTPECSIFGAEQVVQRGPAMIEIDIRTTVDGKLVCVHDKTLERGTTGTGAVEEVTADYIKGLKLRDAVGKETDKPISTFEEFLDWGNNGALLWLDTKAVDPAQLVAMIREQKAESRVIVSAYGKDILTTYQKLAPDLVYFVPYIEPLALPDLAAILATGIDPKHLIGFAGYDIPNMRGTLALADIDAPALLDLQRIDSRYKPDNVNADLYVTAVAEGLPMFNTEQYDKALDALKIVDWA